MQLRFQNNLLVYFVEIKGLDVNFEQTGNGKNMLIYMLFYILSYDLTIIILNILSYIYIYDISNAFDR